ncbi:hypothetical protein CPter91_3759 [Collimonas pratensis]|uniref:Uncharacterized protein n=1 Tax=Collimonas pratensis TaxID=279113 RepID=A0A127Q7M7_9BURK|nr:hypothetical protein CPter91_3759 [Collimonas pratensis]
MSIAAKSTVAPCNSACLDALVFQQNCSYFNTMKSIYIAAMHLK